ncbi:hypothetical protein [Streptomyces sp. NPDC052225]|uniref:hypothetical protein n=1 Tax=Streptomyces sp. NPDC052225 TaxID=3154949 RepID=UPI00341C97BD
MDGAQWLASCHRRPAEAYAAWEQSPYLVTLPAGRTWDALRLPQPLGLTVLWELGRAGEAVPVLEEHAKPRPVFYILTTPGTAGSWPQSDEVRMVTAGQELRMPSPAADAITGVRHHSFLWRVPPDGSGYLADPEQLRAALASAQDPDRQAERVRAARAVFWASKRHSP